MDLKTERPLRSGTPKKSRSIWKCLLVFTILISTLVALALGYALYTAVTGFFDSLRNPHGGSLHSTSIPHSSASAVYPFFDHDTPFDVVLTVWVRVPESHSEEERVKARESFGVGKKLRDLQSITRVPEDELLFPIHPEQCIHSEVIMRNLRMKDRNVHKDVELDIPLQVFRDNYTFSSDVRMAITLIPPMDKLEQVRESSFWIPDSVKLHPRLEPKMATALGLTSAQQHFLDEWSYGFGLVEFNAPRAAPLSAKFPQYEADVKGADDDHEDSEEDGDYEEEEEEEDLGKEDLVDWRYSMGTPHLVTRSHIYLLDETRLFNRTKYEQAHAKLRSQSCGQAMKLPPSRLLCRTDYQHSGQWEHKLLLSPSERGQDPEFERVAYGPFLGQLKHMRGPKDLVRVPVNRTSASVPGLDNENASNASLQLVHHFTFSTLSPARIGILDNLANPNSHHEDSKEDASESQLARAQSQWEQWGGLLGNRGHGTHPKTRLLLAFITDIALPIPISILTALYWYTRLTSAGIHASATLISALNTIIDSVYLFFLAIRKDDMALPIKLIYWTSVMLELIIPWYKLRTVLPFELGWTLGLRRVGWTKRERATRRAEKAIGWVMPFIIFTCLSALIYYTGYYSYHLISPLHQLPPQNTTELVQPYWYHAPTASVEITAQITQLWLNASSRQFAGQYKLTAFMVGIRRLAWGLGYVRVIAGRKDVRDGVLWEEAVWAVVDVAWVVQAALGKRVEQESQEDEED